MSAYYSDDEEIDIRVRRGRTPPVYDDPRPRHRPSYYSRGGGQLEIARGSYERSVSRGHYRERSVSPAPPPAQAPIIINNRIDNIQDDDDYDGRGRYLPMAVPVRTRSTSRRRDTPPRDTGYMTREEYELERTRKELERYKIQVQREEDEKHMKKEMELKVLLEEKKAEDEKRKKKEDEERAVKEWKAKEAEKKEQEKKKKEDEERAIREWKAREAEKKEKDRKEKEEREAEYKKRLEEDLRKSGMDDRQIALVLKKDKDGERDPNRPTYTRMSRKYLSIETLRELRIEYTLDTDPEYILIKRWVPEYEQDFLWNHTRALRERVRQPVVLAIEEKKTHKHHNHKDDEFEIVRKHKRRPSPSPLVTFFAGGKSR